MAIQSCSTTDMELKCYKVKCRLEDGSEREVGVMCSDETAAKRVAENSLLEGSSVRAKAFSVEETDSI